MALPRFRCSQCKSAKDHMLITDWDDILPIDVVCVQCVGCSRIRIRQTKEALKTTLEQLADELGGDCS
jgi:hypothetical protein